MLIWIFIVTAWLIFILGSAMNFQVLLRKLRAKEGESAPSDMPLVPAIAGVCAVYFTLPQLAQRGWEAPWPLLWILLPLVLDVGTLLYLIVLPLAAIESLFTNAETRDRVPFLRYFFRKRMPDERPPVPRERAITGCILGTAVGDALGLACEGLSLDKQQKMFPKLEGYRFLPCGKGMISDDTEHACMVAQSLIRTAGYVDAERHARMFASDLGWRLRFWLLGLPAGIGLATLRAILKLWIGFPARYSGVSSAGNGPAMRAALIGICYGEDAPKLLALVRASTRVTHTDARAEQGALAVALAAHLAATRRAGMIDPKEYRELLAGRLEPEAHELLDIVDGVIASVEAGEPAAVYAERIGCGQGVTGYMYHTVPVALQVWLRRPADVRGALLETVRLGGDTDTVAAIVGALIGAHVGEAGIPPEWLRDLWEWPRSVAWMKRLSARLADRIDGRYESGGTVTLNPIAVLLRNIAFLVVVLLHGMWRMARLRGRSR